MVKTKYQKHNSKKQPHIKKPGKQADISQFCAQLDALGLQIIQVTADGNCFFRALADQLEGDQEEHGKYRSIVVQYIMKNPEMFEPFIEDDVPFDEYCRSMEEDGMWAGNLELQAASLVTHSNICIHRMLSPRWYIRNFDDIGARMVHLSYHDEEHYNSVRLKEDTCQGPARSILIKADTDPSATSLQAKVPPSKSHRGASNSITNPGIVKLVMAGSGCENSKMVEQVLLQVDGDVDAAIEFLVAEQGSEEYTEQTELLPSPVNPSGVDETKDSQKQGEEVEQNHSKENASSNRVKRVNCSSNSLPDDKKIPRNKLCPCGSRKKYKACCGSVVGRSLTKSIVNENIVSKKGKRDRKLGKKETDKAELSSGSDLLPTDLGALCI